MNKILWGLFMTVFLLAACSNETLSDDPTSDLNSNKVKEEQEKNYEDEFIKGAIESSLELQESIEELKTLFDFMEVTDAGWRIEVDRYALKAQMAANMYTLNENFLNDEEEEKYKNTMKFYNDGIKQIHSIYSDIFDALKTYDKKTLLQVKSQLDPAIELINKGTEQLEIERYQ